MTSTYSFQSYDLDLDQVDQTSDPGILLGIFQKLINADSDFKILPARQWVENFLYYCGIRNMGSRFDSGTVVGSSFAFPFQSRSFYQEARRRIPKLFKAVQVQAANMTKQRPTIKAWPLGDDESSERQAKMANICIDYFWDADFENDKYYEAMLWALLSPMVARKDYITYDFNKERLWPVDEPMMDPVYGQPIIDPNTGQPVIQAKRDEDGNPILEQHPWTRTEIVSAFNLIFNPSASWVNDLDYAGDVSVKRLSWVRQNFDREEEGFRPWELNDLKPGSWSFTPIQALGATLKQLTFGAFQSYRNWNYGLNPMRDGCVCADFYIRPSANAPEGRRLYFANGKLLYDGAYAGYRGRPTPVWHPYSYLTYERVPGRPWGTDYASKLTDLNRVYEQLRTEFGHLRRTFSKPKMAIPIGAQVERDTITGQEEIYRYNPFAPGGGTPAFLNPPQPPTTIVDDGKMVMQEFVEASGVTEIQMGIRPQGVTTYRGLEVLREEANNSQNNFIRMFEEFIERSQWNKLENIRKCLTKPDKNLQDAIKIFKKMTQYVTDVDITMFTGDDLAGVITVEPYSTISKSKVAMQDKYGQLAQLGVLGDVVNDPDLNTEFKKKMDITGFEQPKNKQVQFAKYENQMMMQAEKMQTIINPPVQQWHDDPVHIREVENLLLDPTLQDKQLIMQSLLAHREAHLMSMAQKQAAQMQAAMAMGGIVPPGAQPGGAPGQNGGGDRQKVDSSQPMGQNGDQMMFGPEMGMAQGNAGTA